jgi:aspartyl-tRNA(Asn)/glutamyl-tRNA(Gln) amidotransferase subunit B
MSAVPEIVGFELVVGLEVHVELATRTKMFTRVPSPAHLESLEAEPNTFIDPVVLALPGSLPVMNKAAVEMAMMVGVALNCAIARETKWDRKGYFYPDLPKAYQISQYDLPICFDGAVELPAVDEKGFPDLSREPRRIGIMRAHLEEDAGKLLHEAPGGHAIDFSIVDLNRAGTPLLEIVTQPDFRSADEVVLFAKMLRTICRFLRVTQGVMQKGHMRFEPNINGIVTLSDGQMVTTPIVEVKNLNSFKALKAAIEFEAREQPRRWLLDRRVMGKGTKTTRGWDDAKGCTFVQREKEDAHDYRYFPDPDLVPVIVDDEWKARVSGRVPELPMARFKRYVREYGLGVMEASALVDERDTCEMYESCIGALSELGVDRPRAGKLAANWLLGAGLRLANERHTPLADLGISAGEVAAVAKLREDGKLNNQSADDLFGLLCDEANAARAAFAPPAAELARVEEVSRSRGWLIVRDDAAMEKWIDQVLAVNDRVADDVRAGKVQAAGRLVGEVMKLAAGKADAKLVRELILKKLGQG